MKAADCSIFIGLNAGIPLHLWDEMRGCHYDTETNDRQLCIGLARSEDGAFAQIYERYFDELFRRAYKILGDTAGAEDAVQETFAALWKYRAGLDIQNLGAYLNRSLRNEALKAYQARKTDALFFERLAKASNELLSSDPVTYNELQRRLVELIKALPGDQQMIYNLSREQQLSNQQIANHMHISVKTVEKKMTLSLKYLRAKLINGYDHIIHHVRSRKR